MSYDLPPSDPTPEQPGPAGYGQVPYGQPQYGGPVAPNHPSATTALVLGILSLVCLGFLTGIPAIIIGRRAVREIDASRGQLGGRGNAQAGFVTGLIGTIWSVLVFLFVVGVFIFGSMLASSFDNEDCSIQGDVPTYNC